MRDDWSPERNKAAKRMIRWLALFFLFAGSAAIVQIILGVQQPHWEFWVLYGCGFISLVATVYYFVKQSRP